jgi:GNAT superfamily N-acetyltransferase
MTRHALALAEAPDLDAFHDEGETMEMRALASLHAAATPEMRDALGLCWGEDGEASVSAAAALPASAIVVNRAVVRGAAALPRLAAGYRAAGIGRFFLHLPPGVEVPPDVLRDLALRDARPWQKFVRLRGAPVPDTAPVQIERVHPGPAAEAVARIVCAAFDLGQAAEPWVARLCRDDRWQVFLARVDGAPAGTGALFSDGGIGWTDWGATAPAFRGRGVQRALLAHRLRVADRSGLPRVHTCTGAPAPGDPQHSYRNILRCGFVETVQRRNLAPAA